MALTAGRPATEDRRTYLGATLGGALILLLLGLATPLVPRQGGLRDGVGITLIVALVLGWHVLSYARARAARMIWLLAAPALSLLGGYVLMAALIEGDAHYQTGGPAWLGVLGLLGIPAMFLWPAAWVTLAVVKTRRVAA